MYMCLQPIVVSEIALSAFHNPRASQQLGLPFPQPHFGFPDSLQSLTCLLFVAILLAAIPLSGAKGSLLSCIYERQMISVMTIIRRRALPTSPHRREVKF